MQEIIDKISIDHRSSTPLGQQLYNEFYRLILSRQIAAGTALPPSRLLAKALKIARATVTATYEQLKIEGYVTGEGRNGTRVSPLLAPDPKRSAEGALKKSPSYSTDKYSPFAQSLLTQPLFDPITPERELPLYGWGFALEQLPIRQFAREWNKLLSSRSIELFEYPSDSLGLPALRNALARYLKRVKGITVAAEQIVIVSGWQQGLDLSLRLHVKTGDVVALENPSYPTVWRMVWAHGGQIRALTVDQDGMKVEDLVKARGAAKLVYVTPSHQFPTGSVLSPARRVQLLDWAASCDAIVVEEEHDSDFRYSGHPVPALKMLDRFGSVIYSGNFSKSWFPGLGLGYIIVPERLIDIYSRARSICGEQVTTLIQQLAANLIESGDLERHVKKMRAIYGERRNQLITSLKNHLRDRVEILGDSSGMHVMVRVESKLRASEIVARAGALGVGLMDTTMYYFDFPPVREFLMGYGALLPNQIDDAIRRLARLI